VTLEHEDTASELATNLSSEDSPGRLTHQEKSTLEYHPQQPNPHGHKYQDENSELPVLALLHERSVDVDLELTEDDIVHWVDDMQLSPGKIRHQHLTRILSQLDERMNPHDCEGVIYCPVNRSHNSKTRKENDNGRTSSKNVSNPSRKTQSRSRISKQSTCPSESSRISSNAPTDEISPLSRMLSCPFVKRNPSRYILVSNSCTERFGFPNPGKLV
jgi:hypothetical protein